ncbi:MAG: nucleotidyltransferase substrate binding protein, family [Ignavibacteria bacterium]|nr:nucleotidyltransferase substrate binding protein, family [Ignavibacteria bacterium]
MSKESRWRHRFRNFEKAFVFFDSVANKEVYSPLEIAGLVQSFEFTFELALKTVKDYLYEQGIPTNFPREAIKEGFRTGIIEDGHTWLEMLEKRNELTHTYNSEVAENAVDVIKNHYIFAVSQVYQYLKLKYDEQ